MKTETRLWVDKAHEHLGSAEALSEGGFPSQTVFFCQQAIELLLKALWVERTGANLPPRTHELVALAARWRLELTEERLQFLQRLEQQYMPTRYPEMATQYMDEDASAYLQQTKEFFAWLLPQLS